MLARAQARVDAPAGTWTRPDPLAPVATEPRFAEPMYDGLQRVAPCAVPARASSDVEADGVALLETTPRVIEAYMAGLNHELSRELLWREFPASLDRHRVPPVLGRQRPARRPGALADIPPLSEWASAPLGRHLRGGAGQLVLLVRGELLRRYPTTTIYAARATAAGALDPATRLAPMFRGALAPDIVLRRLRAQRGERAGDRSGRPGLVLRLRGVPGRAALRVRRGRRAPASRRRRTRSPGRTCRSRPPATPTSPSRSPPPPTLQGVWGKNAAGTASLTFQQPFRVAHARVAADREERRMTDLAAIAAARAKGQAAEADALALADRLVAAKADRARAARRPRASCPARITALQQARRRGAGARGRGDAGRATRWPRRRAPPTPPRTAAEAAAAAAERDARRSARQDLDELHAGGRRAPAVGAARGARRRAVRRRARRDRGPQPAGAAARSAADALGAPLAAADAELQAAQAELAAASAAARGGQRRSSTDARSRQAAVEALPAKLSADIAAQRTRVTTAWQPWDALLAAAHGAIADRGRAAELERLRAELVAGENPDDLVALVATDAPARAAAGAARDALRRRRPARADLPGQRSTSTRTSRS